MGGKRVIIKAVKTLLYLDSEKLILKLMLATLMFIARLFTITKRWKQPKCSLLLWSYWSQHLGRECRLRGKGDA